jgi:hypothetical protein
MKLERRAIPLRGRDPVIVHDALPGAKKDRQSWYIGMVVNSMVISLNLSGVRK